jgi:hypothetical protein
MSATMSGFRWTLHDRTGNELRATETFESKQEAETWLGDRWMTLLDEGAESVSLLDDGRVVYRMGLREQ